MSGCLTEHIKEVMCVNNDLNTSQIGLITELKCITYLLEHGWNVLLPQGNYTKYDIVIEKNNKFYRIQCKHASKKEDNAFIVRTQYMKRHSAYKNRYTINDCDYFMTEYEGQYYIFPIFGTTETKFWLNESSHHPMSKLAKDYLAEIILNKL